jgi:hypothetical protein
MEQPRVVICGSMSHYEVMMRYCDQLNRCGIPTLIPDNERALVGKLSREEILQVKCEKSRIWLEEVKSSTTYGILVVNESKKGVDNYIGASTFAEIAIAFNAYKRIFLLHDLYAPYEDELLAWKAVPLLGHLEGLISAYRQASWGTVFQNDRVGWDGARNGSSK